MIQQHLSDSQLQELKATLLGELGKLEKTIEVLEEQDPFKNPEHVLDNAAIDTDVREQLGHETVEAEVKALRQKLERVENALRKMENGTYGFDEQTNEPIPFERLQVVPEARYTIENEQRLVK